MMRTLFAASCLAGIVIAGAPAGPASAGGGNPSGTGPPNQTCQNSANSAGQLSTPGHSGSSPGSVFNEPMFGSPNGGTGGRAYNAAGAPSQYDNACFKNQSGNLSPPSAPASTAPTTSASSSSTSSSSTPASTAPTTAKTGNTTHH
jgi:hypothetical protein